MSLLAYTGIGSLILTASALVKIGMENLSREANGGNINGFDAEFGSGLPGGRKAVPFGVVATSNGNGDYPRAQRGGHDRADRSVLSGADLPDPAGHSHR